MKNRYFVFIFIITILMSCSQRVSTIVGFDYDEKKNQTNYFVLPYGTATIPGKWEKTNYVSSSRQQYFRNKDTVTISIAFGACNYFKFNSNKSKIGFEFAKAHYEWDSQYYVKNHGLNRELIELDSLNNFIMWRIHGISENHEIDNILLVGDKNCHTTILTITDNDKWTDLQKVDLLKKIYLNK